MSCLVKSPKIGSNIYSDVTRCVLYFTSQLLRQTSLLNTSIQEHSSTLQIRSNSSNQNLITIMPFIIPKSTTKDNSSTISSPNQHVYIPNLMGLQMLQIARCEQKEEEEIMEYDSPNITPLNTPASSAPSSPRSSISYNIPDDAF
jgi:hypothetical protein